MKTFKLTEQKTLFDANQVVRPNNVCEEKIINCDDYKVIYGYHHNLESLIFITKNGDEEDEFIVKPTLGDPYFKLEIIEDGESTVLLKHECGGNCNKNP